MTWVPQVLSVNGGKVPVDVNALIREVHRTVGEATNVRVVPSAKGGLNIYFEGVTYRHAEFREKINFMDRHREHNLLKTGPYIMADFMDAFKVRFVVASEPKSPISIYIPQKGSVVVEDSPVMPGEVGMTLVAPYVPRSLNPYTAVQAFATVDKATFYPRTATVSRVVFEGVRFKQSAAAIKAYFEESKSSSGIYVYLTPTSYLVITAMRTVVGGTHIPVAQPEMAEALEDEINFDL